MPNNLTDFANVTPLWLVGAGPMAVEYAKVLISLQYPFLVIGRGAVSAKDFESAVGVPVERGGLDLAIRNKIPCQKAIIATGVEQLASNACSLIEAGTQKILVEKPGGLNGSEIRNVYKLGTKYNCEVFMGYNRRFYSSVERAQEIIRHDGGVSSFHFEFTEWSHLIRDLKKASGVKEHWFLANSSHVVDLAFYLGGIPGTLDTHVTGKLDWHPSGSRFFGSGVTSKQVPFSYLADWTAPGRWRVEILTQKSRLIFCPLEKLQIQFLGSVEIQNVDLEDEIDLQYKPGLYMQVKAFLNSDPRLCTIAQQHDLLTFYEKMANYI